MNVFSRFRTGGGTFLVKDLRPWNVTNFTNFLSYITAKEKHFYSRFKESITRLLFNFITLENLFSKLIFRKDLPILLFFSAMSPEQESTIIESLKFTDSIYRISQETISLVKV